MKHILIFIILFVSLNSKEILISNKDIKYHEILDYKNLMYVNSDKKVLCKAFNKEILLNTNYRAKRYIIKGHPICQKNVQIYIKNKIRYDFGNIVIEKDGKIIGETSNYVKIKNLDGTVDKIYKNGQVK